MVRGPIAARAAGFLLLVPFLSAPRPDDPAQAVTAPEAEALIRYHNKVRDEVGVGPVKWSPALAKFAQAWADEVARTGKIQHRPGDGEFAQKYGENIAWGTGDGFDVQAAARLWYEEKPSYTPGTPIPQDFGDFKAGHYTQMIWKGSTEIGAGKAVIQTGDLKGSLFIVCNYNPRGNMIGEAPFPAAGVDRRDARGAGEIRSGAASVSITPDRPIALAGQMHTRISTGVRSPVTANALAIERVDAGKPVDQAIFVSCDLVGIDPPVVAEARKLLKGKLPDFDGRKLIVSATHTHTGPVQEEGAYRLPDGGIMRPAEYSAFLAARIAEVAATAWEARKPSKIGWGLGHAVVAQNRRAMFADGKAIMYGPTERDEFRGFEGPEDQGVEVLFVWSGEGKLIATAVNVACPSQEVEGESVVDADFWHEIRESLRARHGKGLIVIAWTGAAGDQSPHLMVRKKAEDRMRALRKLSRLEELARRVVAAWEEALEGASQERHADLPFVHKVETVELPLRAVTDEEAAATRAEIATLSKDPNHQRWVVWHQDVLDRYERQKAGTARPYAMELHAIRLGDVAIATNSFELFTQYGLQIKARSRALQTFVIQLTGPGTYLPTAPAVKGGGYSAVIASSVVGPEGGQVLVDRTVALINSLWPEEPK